MANRPFWPGEYIMATEKVGVYRKYYGTVPKDKNGDPLPKSKWPKKRNHRWIARWFGSEGKRYSKSFASRKEADTYAENRQSKVRKGKRDLPQKITVKEFQKEHCKVMKHQRSKNTIKDHLRVLRLFADHVGPDVLLNRISSRDAESFVAHRLEQGCAAGTVNKDIRTLKGIFNLAIELRAYLPEGSNPFMKIKQRKIADKTPNYLPREDFESLFLAAGTIWWKTLIVLAYTSGARMDELINLTWDNIDFQSHRMTIARKDKDKWIQPWQPKDYEMREIPLPEQAVNLLATLQSNAPEMCPYVFMELERWEYYRETVSKGTWQAGQKLVNNVLRRFKTLCRKAMVGFYTFHDLRRTCLTNWAKDLPTHVVQKLAGHSDIRTTQKYYLSVQEDDICKAQRVQAKLLENILTNDLTDPKVTPKAQKRSFGGQSLLLDNL